MKWDGKLYDNAQNYVSEYGKGLIEFIPRNKVLDILDLGCGTGDLTKEIHDKVCSSVTGIDSSVEMINEARHKYPNIKFELCNAIDLQFEQSFDVVFSNAVFHWIIEQDKLHKSIYNILNPKGVLICEFGASNNIANISSAFANAIQKYGDTYISPFYFPTLDEHVKTLENNGFIIEQMYDFDRPTPLPNGKFGLSQWVRQFFSFSLSCYEDIEQEKILHDVEDQLKNRIFDGERWIADYRRLRVIAHK